MNETPPTRLRLTVSVLACVLLAVSWMGCTKTAQKMRETPVDPTQAESGGMSWARFGQTKIQLEIADTPDLRATGLAGRRSLGKNEGMIFVYGSSDERSFWMKDCLMGLDIAFLDGDARVIVVHSVDPPVTADGDFTTVSSGARSRYVVEMTRGWFFANKVNRGQQLELSPDLQRRARRLARTIGREE